MKRGLFFLLFMVAFVFKGFSQATPADSTEMYAYIDSVLAETRGPIKRTDFFNLLTTFNSYMALQGVNGTGLISGGDTASMLTPYISRNDTAAAFIPFIERSDTSSMLSSYIQRSDTASMLTPYISRNDTAAAFAPFIERGDTSAMLSSYRRKNDLVIATDFTGIYNDGTSISASNFSAFLTATDGRRVYWPAGRYVFQNNATQIQTTADIFWDGEGKATIMDNFELFCPSGNYAVFQNIKFKNAGAVIDFETVSTQADTLEYLQISNVYFQSVRGAVRSRKGTIVWPRHVAITNTYIDTLTTNGIGFYFAGGAGTFTIRDVFVNYAIDSAVASVMTLATEWDAGNGIDTAIFVENVVISNIWHREDWNPGAEFYSFYAEAQNNTIIKLKDLKIVNSNVPSVYLRGQSTAIFDGLDIRTDTLKSTFAGIAALSKTTRQDNQPAVIFKNSIIIVPDAQAFYKENSGNVIMYNNYLENAGISEEVLKIDGESPEYPMIVTLRDNVIKNTSATGALLMTITSGVNRLEAYNNKFIIPSNKNASGSFVINAGITGTDIADHYIFKDNYFYGSRFLATNKKLNHLTFQNNQIIGSGSHNFSAIKTSTVTNNIIQGFPKDSVTYQTASAYDFNIIFGDVSVADFSYNTFDLDNFLRLQNIDVGNIDTLLIRGNKGRIKTDVGNRSRLTRVDSVNYLEVSGNVINFEASDVNHVVFVENAVNYANIYNNSFCSASDKVNYFFEGLSGSTIYNMRFFNNTGTKEVIEEPDMTVTYDSIKTSQLYTLDGNAYLTEADTAAMLNGYARQKAFIDTAAALRSSIGSSSGGVQFVSTVVELVAADTTLAAFWTDTLQGGLFIYYTNPIYTVTVQDSGMAYLPSTGNGAWVRYATGALRPEWFGAKGDGVTEDHKALNNMFSFVARQSPSNYVIEFRQGKTYLTGGRITITNTDIFLRGNDATLKRAALDSTSLKYQASNGQNYVVVNNASIFKQSDQVVVLKNGTDNTSYNHSAYQIISSISEDTLYFTANLADNNPSTPAGNYALGSMVYKSWDMLEFAETGSGKQEHTAIIENLTLDGNKDNWPAPLTWTVDQAIDHDHFLIIRNCKFVDMPSDCIIGNVSDIQNSFFQNNNASCLHFSYSSSETRKRDHTAYIKNNVFYDNCQIDNDHSEGVIVWSAAVGNVRIENNYVDTSAFGFLGTSDASTVGNIYIFNNIVKNCATIHQIGYDTDERKEIRWEGNKITNSGRLFYQYLTDSNNVYFVNNEFNDSCKFYVLRGGSVTIDGNIFYNNYDDVQINEPYDLKFTNNTIYNGAANIIGARNRCLIDGNNWFNNASHTFDHVNQSFLFVQGYSGDYGKQKMTISNNFFQDNNTNNSTYNAIQVQQYNMHVDVVGNKVYNIEKPIRVVNSIAGADTTRLITVADNIFWSKTRTVNQGADNAFQNEIIIRPGMAWRNNWVFADKYQTEIFKRQSLNDREHIEFTGNTVWIQNNGGQIFERNITAQDNLGLYVNNIYNGSVVLGDRSQIGANNRTYSISDRNLNLQIQPNILMPQNFAEWR